MEHRKQMAIALAPEHSYQFLDFDTAKSHPDVFFD